MTNVLRDYKKKLTNITKLRTYIMVLPGKYEAGDIEF